MSNNFWTGDKVRLRAVESKDAGIFYKWASDYDDESDRFCDEIHFPSTYDAMVARVEARSKREPNNNEFIWIIENADGVQSVISIPLTVTKDSALSNMA